MEKLTIEKQIPPSDGICDQYFEQMPHSMISTHMTCAGAGAVGGFQFATTVPGFCRKRGGSPL